MLLFLLASCLPAHPGADKDFRVSGGEIVALPINGSGSCEGFFLDYYNCYLEVSNAEGQYTQDQLREMVADQCQSYTDEWAATFACASGLLRQTDCSSQRSWEQLGSRINSECVTPEEDQPQRDTAYGEDDEG